MIHKTLRILVASEGQREGTKTEELRNVNEAICVRAPLLDLREQLQPRCRNTYVRSWQMVAICFITLWTSPLKKVVSEPHHL